MNCSGYEKQMSDYLDGRLSTANEDALRFHMNGCPRCRLKIKDMESAIRAVKSLPPATPQPEFEYQLSSVLTKEIARELYAVSWWRRVTETFSELGELSRQRPVQMVFATSLILTVTVIGGFAGLVAPQDRPDSSSDASMAVSLPTPFEPELAPPDPISPFPLERASAPPLATGQEPNAEQVTNLPSPAVTRLSLTTSLISGDRPGVLTVQTMEPMAHGIRSVSSGTGMPLDPSLFTEAVGGDLVTDGGLAQSETEERLLQVGIAEANGLRGTGDQSGPSGPGGPVDPAAPIRRVRISF